MVRVLPGRSGLFLPQFVKEFLLHRGIQHADRLDLVQGGSIVHLDIAPEGMGLHLPDIKHRMGNLVCIDTFPIYKRYYHAMSSRRPQSLSTTFCPHDKMRISAPHVLPSELIDTQLIESRNHIKWRNPRHGSGKMRIKEMKVSNGTRIAVSRPDCTGRTNEPYPRQLHRF